MEELNIKEIVRAVGGTLLNGDEKSAITSVSTNSKEIGRNGLFVPIIGERVDAHDFIYDAFDNGAAAVFTSREISHFIQDKVYIKVEDTKNALQILASYYRDKFLIPVIGVTGSVGKTTTKEMIAKALEPRYKVLKTAGNMNSQIGLPLMMFEIEKTDEIAVIEMGISDFGEMERLCAIAKPTIAVMTNIGVSHIANLKTRENIRMEKLNIINEFSDSGILYINGNDKLLKEIKEYTKMPQNSAIMNTSMATRKKLQETYVCSFGTMEECDYQASNIEKSSDGIKFIYQSKEREEEITLGVLGEHNVFNGVVALAIAEHFKVPLKEAKEALKEYRPIAMRGQIKEVRGMKLIDDTYNASPDSMKSGISMLLELESKRRVAVLADVWELGERSYQLHYEVGEFIAGKKIDLVVTIGKEAKAIIEAINKKDATILTASFHENEEAIRYLKEQLKPGDAVLIKGSRGMHTEEIFSQLSI